MKRISGDVACGGDCEDLGMVVSRWLAGDSRPGMVVGGRRVGNSGGGVGKGMGYVVLRRGQDERQRSENPYR